MKMIGIYGYKNLINNKWYIGQSIDIQSRKYMHEYLLKNNKEMNRHFYRALKKYGLENFEFNILEECKREELNKKEQYWIKYYNSYNNGYNLTLGGDGCIGNKHSKGSPGKRTLETCLKISESSKGRIPWNKGHRKENDERVAKIAQKTSILLIGNNRAKNHKCSEESKQSNREKHLGKSPGNKGKKLYINSEGKRTYI